MFQGYSKDKNFTSATVDWISKKYLPFSFFDDKDTQDYFRMIDPNIKIPSRFTIRREVGKRFKELQTWVKDQLSKCTSKVSFTIDGWTSIANRSFYGITIHFIDNEWNYQSMVLDFVASHGKHTGYDIAQVFYKSVVEYDLLNKIQGITVDNASANTKFMLELQKLLPHFDAQNQHFRCMAHVLNLGVQDLMKSLALNSSYEDNDNEDPTDEETNSENESDAEEDRSGDEEMDSEHEDRNKKKQETLDSSTCINKIRSIFTKIRRSEKLNKRFHSACETVSVSTNISPILDCPTRWNSTHDMIGIALKLKQGISTFCSSVAELNEFQIIDEEWVILEKIHKFLINFKNLTTKLGGDKYVTLPFVIVSFNLLLDRIETVMTQLDSKIPRSEVDEQLILGFQAARDKMLKHYVKTNWVYCTTLILDPKHKAETFDMTAWGLEMKKESLRRFENLYEEYRLREPVEEPMDTREEDRDDEDAIDFNRLYSPPSSSTGSQSLKKELEQYLKEPRATRNEDPLHWWKRHELQFPILAKMARDFLSISATSVPAERLFSKASLVIRKHRNRLNNESARWLLCINSWASIKNKQ